MFRDQDLGAYLGSNRDGTLRTRGGAATRPIMSRPHRRICPLRHAHSPTFHPLGVAASLRIRSRLPAQLSRSAAHARDKDRSRKALMIAACSRNDSWTRGAASKYASSTRRSRDLSCFRRRKSSPLSARRIKRSWKSSSAMTAAAGPAGHRRLLHGRLVSSKLFRSSGVSRGRPVPVRGFRAPR